MTTPRYVWYNIHEVIIMNEVLYEGDYAYVDGYKFRKDTASGYYLGTQRIDGVRKRLHIYMWEKYNGMVPKGYEINHIDENKDDNEIKNLQCMTKSDHIKWHAKHDRAKMIDKWRKNLDKARIEAAKWHKSPEGREWHKEHAYHSIINTEIYHKKCLNCGKNYIAKKKFSKFCSPKCQTAYRVKSGKDNITAKCLNCGKPFVKNEYSTGKYCSEKCGVEYRFKQNTFKAKGYTKNNNGRYIAYLSFNGKRIYLGSYSSSDQASKVHIEKSKELIKTF